MWGGNFIRPTVEEDLTRSGKYPKQFLFGDSSIRCGLRLLRVRNPVAEGEGGVAGRQEPRRSGFQVPGETCRGARVASPGRATGDLSWPGPEGDLRNVRRTSREIR